MLHVLLNEWLQRFSFLWAYIIGTFFFSPPDSCSLTYCYVFKDGLFVNNHGTFCMHVSGDLHYPVCLDMDALCFKNNSHTLLCRGVKRYRVLHLGLCEATFLASLQSHGGRVSQNPRCKVFTERAVIIHCVWLQVINEAYRVLKPGGRFMCLEFSQVTNPLLRR